jgi:hypothetical protein
MRRRLVLGIVVLAGVLALGEGGSRLAERFGCRNHCALYWDANPLYGWGHAPGASGWCQGCFEGRVQWRMRGRFNRQGLRDERDIPYERQDSFRILVLGDSYTEGLQVDVPFTRLLEQRLNAAAPAGRRFEVLNAGIAGWGTDNALLYFVHEGWRYRPDLVLLAFDTGNDVFENHRPLLRSTSFYPFDKPFFELSDGRLVLRQFPLPVPGWRRRLVHRLGSELGGHSALYRLLSRLPRPHLPRLAGAEPASLVEAVAKMDQNYLADTPPAWRDAWRISRGLVLKLRAAAEARGSRFAVVIVNGREEVTKRWRWLLNMQPAFHALPQDYDKPNRLLTQFLARRGIPLVPMLEEFRAAFGETGTPGFYPWDVHWAPAGHELAARVIDRSLRAQGLVPLPPAGGDG